jgi:signal peptidase I
LASSSEGKPELSKLLKYSYADQKTLFIKRLRFLGWIALIVLLYLLFTTYLFSARLMESDSMQPGINAGDRFMCYSFAINRTFNNLVSFTTFPQNRGNIVLLDMSRGEKQHFFINALDGVINFFTAGRVSFAHKKNRTFIKRIIALPGDEVSMINNVMRVKPYDNPYTFTEFEVATRPYDVIIPESRSLLDNSLPFSGFYKQITLGENECFVLSDDRNNTNDSRTWGPLPLDVVTGKVIFRYWPPQRVGRP